MQRTGDPLGSLRKTVEERFWAKVNKDGPVPDYAPHLGPCWIWTASLGYRDGYGRFQAGRRGDTPVLAHRWSYLQAGGVIPEDRPQLDHLCRVHRCVNPSHLEPVTNAENSRRGIGGQNMRSKTHCPHGHEYDEANTIINGKGSRVCRKCRDISNRQPRQRKAA